MNHLNPRSHSPQTYLIWSFQMKIIKLLFFTYVLMISDLILQLTERKKIGQGTLIENWDEKKKIFFSWTDPILPLFRMCDKIRWTGSTANSAMFSFSLSIFVFEISLWQEILLVVSWKHIFLLHDNLQLKLQILWLIAVNGCTCCNMSSRKQKILLKWIIISSK